MPENVFTTNQLKIFNYRQVMLDKFELRVKKNANYSLRAFARDLEISPSRLVDILSKRYGLSEEAALNISHKLKLSAEQAELFCALVGEEHARSVIKKKIAKKRVAELLGKGSFEKLDLAVFDTMSSWYHFTLLGLTYLQDFVYDLDWISSALGLEKTVVKDALADLISIGLLKEVNGTIIATEDYTYVGENISSSSIKNFHLQIMEQARAALFSQQLGEKEFLSLTFSFNTEKLPQAKSKLNHFLQKFSKEFGGGTDKKEVYALALQFFKLTKDRQQHGHEVIQ